jgi:hypothetical protein
MNNFWFTWANTSGQFQQWSFLDGGNYFELPPHSSRVEENQYDLGDRINIIVSHKLRVTLVLTGLGWKFEHPTDSFVITPDLAKKTVQLACIAELLPAN